MVFSQMEIDRVKYLLASYLRTRLRKLERFAFHVLRDKSCYDRLSPAEFKFVRECVAQSLSGAVSSLLCVPTGHSALVSDFFFLRLLLQLH